MPKIGFHAPIKGGVHNALIVAKDTGCDTVQLFSRNPRGWMAKPLTLEDVLLFRKTRKQTKISPVLIHCNYLVNLAAADDVMLQKSRESFREEVERALLLGVDYLVVHPGSARGACEADGIALCAASLQIACKGLKFGSLRILLENTAGQGDCIGHRFEHLDEIMRVCPKLPLGVCLDTAHAFTAGYDIREEDGLEALLQRVQKTVKTQERSRHSLQRLARRLQLARRSSLAHRRRPHRHRRSAPRRPTSETQTRRLHPRNSLRRSARRSQEPRRCYDHL